MLNFFDSVLYETIIAENKSYEQVLAMVRLRQSSQYSTHRSFFVGSIPKEFFPNAVVWFEILIKTTDYTYLY